MAWIYLLFSGRGVGLLCIVGIVGILGFGVYQLHSWSKAAGRAECAAASAQASAAEVDHLRAAAVAESDADRAGAEAIAAAESHANEIRRQLDAERAAHAETREQCRGHLPAIGETP